MTLREYYEGLLAEGHLPPEWEDRRNPKFTAPSEVAGYVDLANNTWISCSSPFSIATLSSRYTSLTGEFPSAGAAMAAVAAAGSPRRFFIVDTSRENVFHSIVGRGVSFADIGSPGPLFVRWSTDWKNLESFKSEEDLWRSLSSQHKLYWDE